MAIKRFNELAGEERRRLFSFLSSSGSDVFFDNVEEMERYVQGEVFNGGRNYLTLWTPDRVVAGTIGLITKEAVQKGEVFLTSLYAQPGRVGVFDALWREARRVALVEDAVDQGVIVRLGLRESQAHLGEEVTRSGFRPAYRILELRRDAGGLSVDASGLQARDDVFFSPLTEAEVEDFVAVHNAAFLASPNGGSVSRAEVREMLENCKVADFVQVGYLAGRPAAILTLSQKDDVGWIEGLGVEPQFQGRGLGRLALEKALAVLAARGVSEVRLLVADANARALSLYQRHGFVVDRVFSTWFTGSF